MYASNISHFIFSIILGSTLVMHSYAQIPVRIISHNIRYATTSPFKGEKPWNERRQLLLNELQYNTLHNPEALICLQEVLHEQLVDIMTGLNRTGEEWASIGVGRDDGKTKGEYSPIIYRSRSWEVVNWRTVWLSETPDRPGKGWDAASIRIVTIGHFKHKGSGNRIVGMCTHLDDQGSKSREESAKQILNLIQSETSAKSGSSDRLPVFLAGDLNSEPSGKAYQLLNGSSSGVQDVKDLASWHYGDRTTFTGFQETNQRTEIDHVFVGPRNGGAWTVKGYSVLPNKFEDGVYNSDHEAVVGDVVLIG
jgi:endonuclease/exonuclease/phosphatase family metal-dependent hydrolase